MMLEDIAALARIMICVVLVTTTDSTDHTFQAALYCYKLQVLAFAQAARKTLHALLLLMVIQICE